MSEGTFDITFESLHGLWKFDQDLDPHPPTDGRSRQSSRSSTTTTSTSTGPSARSISTPSGVRISLGGIAKGYAVDRAAKVLEDAGLPAFFVQAGGDLYTRGRKPDGNEWQAGMRDPRGVRRRFFAMLGGERPRLQHRRRLRAQLLRQRQALPPHHRPANGLSGDGRRSVTIWAPTALQADALDDAVFILGPKEGSRSSSRRTAWAR